MAKVSKDIVDERRNTGAIKTIPTPIINSERVTVYIQEVLL